MIRSVCVYCGSASGSRPVYVEAAQALGRTLAESGLTLVYGGGHVGLMGRVADAALAAGGEVIGVIPELLMSKEVGHTGLTRLEVVPDMHRRKQRMADLCDAFIAMPGGAGTLEELFEVYTWAQLGYHRKPIGLLNVEGFYDPLLALLHHTAREGFLREAYIGMLLAEPDPGDLLDACRRYQPLTEDKWAGHRQRI